MVEPLTPANREFVMTTQKEVLVRTPRRGRSKSIVIPDSKDEPRNFPIGRLNNYNKTMKKHRGPLSLMSELESIHEVELSDNIESQRHLAQKKKADSIGSKINIGGSLQSSLEEFE